MCFKFSMCTPKILWKLVKGKENIDTETFTCMDTNFQAYTQHTRTHAFKHVFKVSNMRSIAPKLS